MTKEEYWFWLCTVKDVYQNTIRNLIGFFGDPESVYRADEEELLQSGAVNRKQAHEIIQSRNHYRSLYRLDKLRKDGIRFVYYGSEEYPLSLLTLEDNPYSFYVKGKLPDPDLPTAGIVGSRTCSGYGKEMTLKYAQTLAAKGVQIISGMALGVDSYASRGALEVGGKTFVVLGSGLDVIYPPQNIELYYQIVLNGGGIISEYPMGTPPVGWQFPHRNRLISALSDKLLVMEARKHSGTLTTVAYALSQGKDVYALPGRVTDPLSEGCNRMIADGAGVLLDPMELLEEYYNLENRNLKPEDESEPQGLKERVLKILDYEPRSLEEIAAACQAEAVETARVLSGLELEGLCCQTAKDYYSLDTGIFASI